MLVERDHRGVGPAHQPHVRPLWHAQHQDCGRRLSGVLQPAVTWAGRGQTCARISAMTGTRAETCAILDQLPTDPARRAAYLRAKARRGSAVDALIVATAEPGGAVLTGDPKDLTALAGHAHDVAIRVV